MKITKDSPAHYSYFIILFIALLGLVSLRLDKLRLNPRLAYEQQLHLLALRYGGKPSLNEKDGGVDQPDMAALQDYFMTMDPALLRVPSERLNAAWASMHQYQTKSSSYALEWTGITSEMGGRTRAIMWDPNDPSGKKVWAGGVTGGLWYNPDITSSFSMWQTVSDSWQNLVVSCITYDPNNPLVFYVGTGESQTALITYRESSGRGVGIWKTTNGGQSFTLLPSTAGFQYITKIAVRNESGQSVIYAGVCSGIYKGSVWQSQPSDGLFRSTDGGNSWEQVLPNIDGLTVPYSPGDVQIGASGRIFVGTTSNPDHQGGGTILYSDQGTAGSWTEYTDIRTVIEMDPINNIPHRVVIAPSPSNANIVYAAISAGTISATTNPVYKGYYFLRSDDKGASWIEVSTPDGTGDWANLAWHAMDIAVDPNDPATVYAGGLDMWRTTNSGSSWTHLSDWSLMYSGGGPNYIHADQHIIVYKPGSSTKMLFGSDGGVFYTETGNSISPVFIQKNKNYNTLQFYTCTMHPDAGQNQFIGGLQDNGTLLYQGSPLTINDMIDGGDGAYCFWDQDESNIYITSYYYNRYSIFDGGFQVAYIDNQSGLFINPADYDNSQNVLYANGVDLWGGNANKILRVPNIPQNGNGSFVSLSSIGTSYISHVKVSPYSTSSNTHLFIGTGSGRLFRITNAQNIPVTTEIGSPAFPQSNISCVAIGGSEDTLLVTFSNYGVSSIWQTCNAGSDWREVEGNLPDMPVRWAIYHPQFPNQALIATELGVWSTSNLQSENVLWQPQTSGMANVRVDMLRYRPADSKVLAATHGRGLFTTTFNYDITTSVSEGLLSKMNIFFSSESHEIRMDAGSENHGQARLRLYSTDGRLISDQSLGLRGEMRIPVPRNYKGVLLLKLEMNGHETGRKLVAY
ncbi:MAG: exo-alpha-sialidase [Bacteroidetes bacterium]|nr:exo-alpha-sialidase [Bacteroidota bacterium]